MGQTVGFDIGEKDLKMAVYTGKKFRDAVSSEIPDNLVSEGKILSTDAMAEFIRACAKENKIPKADAAIIIPTELVYTRTVTVPAMTEKQLRYSLPFEFKDYLTTDKSQYYFDYSVNSVSYDEEGNPSELNIFACAVLKETIELYRAVFRKAGFKLKTAIPAESAYANLLEGCAESDGDECFVDIGYSGSRIFIYHNGIHDISRSIDIGTGELDRVIADEVGVEVHMAHSYMLTNFNNVLESEGCAELYNRLAVEIMKAVNFYNYNSARKEALDSIYLTGGGSAVSQLCETIASVTNLQIKPVSGLIGENGFERQGLFAAVCGAAINY